MVGKHGNMADNFVTLCKEDQTAPDLAMAIETDRLRHLLNSVDLHAILIMNLATYTIPGKPLTSIKPVSVNYAPAAPHHFRSNSRLHGY